MKYKKGDIVLVSSRAGDSIPHIHVKLLKRVVVKEKKGTHNGFRKSMDWPGYSGWEATTVYQDEIDVLRKKWSIPYTVPGKDTIFVYDEDIICGEQTKENQTRKRRRRVIRTNKQ